MILAETYKSESGQEFLIYVCEDLEPRTGDHESLRFKINFSSVTANTWSCIVRISGTLQAIWGLGINSDPSVLYGMIKELGILLVKQAIEKVQPFEKFMFSSDVIKRSPYEEVKSKLSEELEKLRRREPLVKEDRAGSLNDIAERNRKLSLKLLQIHYELSGGNSMNLVMRRDVAEELGYDANSDVLLGVYVFLEDEGFLQRKTNIQDCITSRGIKEVQNSFPSVYPSPLKVSIDEIDSFNKAKNVSINEIEDLVPLTSSEDCIQRWFEEIIGEPIHKKDWGGETCDLFTSLLIDGIRKTAAFLLKGPGVRSPELQISNCGKNGDQIQRLFKCPAEVFVIQFIGAISEAVIEEAESKTLLIRNSKKDVQFCIIDGYDSARVLRAYEKI